MRDTVRLETSQREELIDGPRRDRTVVVSILADR